MLHTHSRKSDFQITDSGLQQVKLSSTGFEDRQMLNLAGMDHSQEIFCTTLLTVCKELERFFKRNGSFLLTQHQRARQPAQV